MDQLRDTPAPFVNADAGKHVARLRRHSPVSGPASGYPGVARRSSGYAVATPPGIRGCGVRNATRWGFSAACQGTERRGGCPRARARRTFP